MEFDAIIVQRRNRFFCSCVFLALSSTLLVAFGFLCTAHPQQTEAAKMMEAEAKGKCTECHQSCESEWKPSGHAKAFARENYQKAVANETARAEKCDMCHAPQPILTTGLKAAPEFRGSANAPERGVTCITCHMDSEGAMHGRYAGESDFHKCVKDPNFEASHSTCVVCHGQTEGAGSDYNQMESFALYAKNLKEATCLDCHMRPVERAVAGKTKRQFGQHTWHGAYDEHTLKSAVNLSVRTMGTTTTVTVSNIAGHMMPGGAWRQAVLEICANDKVVKEEVFYREPFDPGRTGSKDSAQGKPGGKTDTRLKPFERKRIMAEIPAGAKVQARLWWKLMPDTPVKGRVLMAQAPQ